LFFFFFIYQNLVAPETFLDSSQFENAFAQVIFFSFQFGDRFIFFVDRLLSSKRKFNLKIRKDKFDFDLLYRTSSSCLICSWACWTAAASMTWSRRAALVSSRALAAAWRRQRL
jgi:hypothetical protein